MRERVRQMVEHHTEHQAQAEVDAEDAAVLRDESSRLRAQMSALEGTVNDERRTRQQLEAERDELRAELDAMREQPRGPAASSALISARDGHMTSRMIEQRQRLEALQLELATSQATVAQMQRDRGGFFGEGVLARAACLGTTRKKPLAHSPSRGSPPRRPISSTRHPPPSPRAASRRSLPRCRAHRRARCHRRRWPPPARTGGTERARPDRACVSQAALSSPPSLPRASPTGATSILPPPAHHRARHTHRTAATRSAATDDHHDRHHHPPPPCLCRARAASHRPACSAGPGRAIPRPVAAAGLGAIALAGAAMASPASTKSASRCAPRRCSPHRGAKQRRA